MTKKMVIINVTAEDIGEPGVWTDKDGNPVAKLELGANGPRCMLDRSLDRAFGFRAFDALIDYAWGTVGSKYQGKTIEFPESVAEKIRAWDNKEPVKPFVFSASIKESMV